MSHLTTAFLDSLPRDENFDRMAFIAAHEKEERITSIRLNPFKKAELSFELNRPVPWATDAFYLDNRPFFTLDPLFHAGCYYVQEAGSMFIELALKHTLDLSQPLKILDLCAAPGGKSTLLNSLLSPGSLLVANELVKNRAAVLAQNLGKWGTGNTVVTNSDPRRFGELEEYFDALVIDAPCSGSGLFRKQPGAIDEWSPEAVRHCGQRQKKILEEVLPCLKEQGILIYSTCSYSVEENEDIVRWLMATFALEYVPLSIDKSWGIVETTAGYRFYPHLVKSEGFFCAVLRKKNTATEGRYRKRREKELPKADLAILSRFIESKNGYSFFEKNKQFHFLSQGALDFVEQFEKQLYFRKAGVLTGEIKGRDLVPDHELALYMAVKEDVPRLELNKDYALKFLRKEVFFPDTNLQGLCLVTYQGLGIGWAKVLPNRLNNYLPNELRILSQESSKT